MTPEISPQKPKIFLQRIKLSRPGILVLALVSIAVLLILASGLGEMKLEPGRLYVVPGEQLETEIDETYPVLTTITLIDVLILVVGLSVLFVIILMMLSPEARKRLIRLLFQLILLSIAVFWAMSRFRTDQEPFFVNAQASLEKLNTAGEAAETVSYIPPVIPPWLPFVTGLLVILAGAAGGWRLWRRLNQRSISPVLVDLADFTRSAIEKISAGEDVNDAVIRCYLQMSAAVDRKRGLQRKLTMTPAEFSKRLEQAGLPVEPVRQLTRLFEKARYGQSGSDQTEANQALSCLQAVLRYIGEAS
ncbi:MAG: DUF4129 domain-containing protein [Anaerolineales bacterium]|nr:DUF4129 domain-containing protein [Anaerolineales bacterium]